MYVLEMSSGSILSIRARPGPEHQSIQPARARKKLYDKSTSPPEPDTKSSMRMRMQHALGNNKNRTT